MDFMIMNVTLQWNRLTNYLIIVFSVGRIIR